MYVHVCVQMCKCNYVHLVWEKKTTKGTLKFKFHKYIHSTLRGNGNDRH